MKKIIITEEEKKNILSLHNLKLINESSRPNIKGIDSKLFKDITVNRENLEYNLKKVLDSFAEKQTLTITVKVPSIVVNEYVCAHTMDGDYIIIPPQTLKRISSNLLLVGSGYKVKNYDDFNINKMNDQKYLKSFCDEGKSVIGDFIWTPHSPSVIYHSSSNDYSGSRINQNSSLGNKLNSL